MRHILSQRTISIDDLRRNFGEIKKELPHTTFILTDRGKQFGLLTATRDIKRALMKTTKGAFKGTSFENDKLWRDVLKKRSRKENIIL